MSKVDVWMPLYIGDYLSSTSRLTTEQHGAYMLLIMDYWKNGPLPDDDAVLAQICRMTSDAWSNASSTLRAFFKQDGSTLRHSRIDAEMEEAKEGKSKRKAKAEAAAAKRWGKDAPSNATGNEQALPDECPSPSPSPSVSNDTNKKKSPAKPPRFDPLELEFPDCLPMDVWKEWISYRRKRNLTCNEDTIKGQLKNLFVWNDAGHSVTEIIRLSIDNGWQGLFEPKQPALKVVNNRKPAPENFVAKNYGIGGKL